MAYAIVKREAMASENVANLRKSFKYLPSGVATAVENGNVVKATSVISGERELLEGSTPLVDTALKDILLVTTPEVMADERKKNLDEFINEAGAIATGDRLISGDIFTVTADAFTAAAATVVVGDVVELAASTKLKVVAAATGLTSGSTQVGTIYDINGDDYAIKVI